MPSSHPAKLENDAPVGSERPTHPTRPTYARRVARFVWRVVDGLRVHHAASAAPAMAFHFFLSLIPVLVLVGFVLGHVVRQRGVDAILGPALDTAPDVAEAIARRELERLAGASAAPIAPLSILVFVWLAASGAHGLMDVFELAVGAPQRSWWKQRAMALTWIAAALVVVALLGWLVIKADVVLHPRTHGRPVATATATASTLTPTPTPTQTSTQTSSSTSTQAAAHHKHPHLAVPPLLVDAWERFVALAFLSVVGIGGLAGFFRVAVKHPRGVRRRVLPGAVVAFASWLVVSWAFGAYVSSLGTYTLYYGGLAAVAVLIVWLYLTSWTLLIGVEVNAQLEGLRNPRVDDSPASAQGARLPQRAPLKRERTSTS